MPNPLASKCEICGKYSAAEVHKRYIACRDCAKKLDTLPQHIVTRDEEYKRMLFKTVRRD